MWVFFVYVCVVYIVRVCLWLCGSFVWVWFVIVRLVCVVYACVYIVVCLFSVCVCGGDFFVCLNVCVICVFVYWCDCIFECV